MDPFLLNPWHIAIFVGAVILLFGSKRLPEVGRSLGKGMREVKRALRFAEEREQAALPPAEQGGRPPAPERETRL